MFTDTPMPDLDLGAIDHPCRPLPWAIVELLADTIDPRIAARYPRSTWLSGADDDSGRPSQLTHGPTHTRRSLPLPYKARDAWRRAGERGLVAPAWLADPRRGFADQVLSFLCPICGGMGAVGYNDDDSCTDCGGKGQEMTRRTLPEPGDVDALWTLARPDLVDAAEALAREAVRRLPDAPAVDRVQWGRLRQGKPHGLLAPVLWSPIWQRLRPPTWDWERMKGPAFRGAPWWRAAARLGAETREMLCFDVGGAWTLRAAGLTDSAFEPLLRLWQLGVVFEELRDDLIVLDRACARTAIHAWRAHVP